MSQPYIASHATAAATRRAPRQDWFDATKGIAIVLVVIGHALGGLIDRPGLDQHPMLVDAFLLIYIVHMPLFMMLSGMTVRARVERAGFGFVTSLGRSIVWPYVLWASVQVLAIHAAASLVNAPIADPVSIILRLYAGAPGQFWFLYALFVLHVCAYALLRLAGPLATVAVLLTLSGLAGTVALSPIWEVTLMNAKWYALGLAAGLAWSGEQLRSQRSSAAVAIIVCAAIMGLVVTFARIHAQFSGELGTASAAALARMSWGHYAVPAAFVGSVLVMLVATWLQGTVAQVFVLLGRASMAIFVLHVLLGAGMRIGAQKFGGVQDDAVLMLLISGVGLLGPLLFLYTVSRLKLDAYLGLGSWPGWEQRRHGSEGRARKARPEHAR